MALTDRAVGRETLRRLSFLSQDGMVLSATLRGLDAVGLLEPSLAREATVAQLRPGLTKIAFGQLRVGLRTLAQAGWLQDAPALAAERTTMRWTDAGRAVAPHHAHFIAIGDLLATFTDNEPASWTQPWEGERAERFAELVDAAAARWELDELEPELRERVTAHLDGALASPVLLWLDAAGGLDGDGATGPELPGGDSGEHAGRLLATLGWIDAAGAWTDAGRHGLEFVAHLGLVGSYLPMFARLPDLYRGDLTATYAPGRDDPESEWHIQHEMHLRASSVAHGRYFADADPIVASIFDREPVAEQPRFIVLTGCDDGRWLVHMDELVRNTTLRGRHLDEHPLRMVGIDRSDAAVARAQEALHSARIEDGLVLRCDTSDASAVRDALTAHGLAIEDGLHVHAFVDHERRYSGGHAPDGGADRSSGAYIADGGSALAGADVEADLSAHLARWAPHVARHGVLVLEAHCVSPAVTARHLGALHSLAFDAYNGYSGQYPVERPAFVAAARRAGLRQAATGERRYPTTRPFVAVSLNHMLGDRSGSMIARGDPDAPRRDTWSPAPGTDLRDGRGLHELVFDHGDLRHPRLWASASTSQLVTQTMDTLEERVERLPRGEVLRVLDYGTGTALAAIEMLKACRERGFEQRLARRGVGFELHLVDIPSSWFAQGHALVQESSWTQCHSLIGADGRFRPLSDVTGGVRMDVVISSMVFHLIPPKALERVAESLAGITAPGGRLLWNAPDLGIPGPYAVAFHHPNRLVRAHWKKLLLGDVEPASPVQRDAIAAARLRAQRGAPLIDDARANKRILPKPHTGEEVGDALRGHFTGEVTTQTHEIVVRETLDTLLVPSNQEEYLPEIEDFDLRSALIEELMLEEVLPDLRAGPAGTYGGYNVHWTFGDFRPNET
ncbi:MAG TPA: class I SAM-dependent methyltransferase [Solirubrobacteraceae bacterium]|nr:class I SAM-dependent methyltransferase [Solirubrobacteraceae bacterium]